MTEAVKTLAYAVRIRVLVKYTGQFALVLCVLTLGPFLASLVFGEYQIGLRYLIVFGILLPAAIAGSRLREPETLQTNETMVIIATAFMLSPLVMSIPMMGAGLPFVDALFEAVSAVTTTGLSTVPSLEHMPRTFLFARAWMQWYGGLGIVVLSVALLRQSPIARKRLIESSTSEHLATTTRIYARRMLAIYALLTIAGLALLWPLLGDGFAALVHVLAAVSTGGFSPYDGSAAAVPGWSARIALMTIGVFGAIPLALYYRAAHGGWLETVRDSELFGILLALVLSCSVLILIFQAHPPTAATHPVLDAVFLGLSAQTTTGFTTLDIAGLDATAKLWLILAMITGGGVGSTAGGIKILRLLILFRLIQMLLQRTAIPSHAVSSPRLGDKALSDEEMLRALTLVLLFLAVVGLSWLIFLLYGYAPIDALFEVASATGTVGLSAGITQPQLETPLKFLLCIDMLLGRLEIIAVLVLLYPRTWIGKRTE